MTKQFSCFLGNAIVRYHKSGARGAARLCALLARAINAEPLFLTTTQHKVRVPLTPRHYIDTEIIRHGYYELEVLEAVMANLKTGDVFWDVGANIGLHSVTVKSLRPDCSVVAFEPSPQMIVRLLQTMEHNGANLQVVQSALWGSPTLHGLHPGQMCNPGMTTLLPKDGDSSPSSFISCHRGDDLVNQGLVPCPNVIKMDVEGAESKVLDGLVDTLKSKCLRAVIFEHTPGGAIDVDSPFMRLPLLGFRVEQLKSRHPARHSNYVAIRQ